MNKILLTCVSLLFVGCIHSNDTKNHSQINKFAIDNRNGPEGDGHTETFNNKTYCKLIKLPLDEYKKCAKKTSSHYANLASIRLTNGVQNRRVINIKVKQETEKLILLVNTWQIALPLKIPSTVYKIEETKRAKNLVITIDVNSIQNGKVVIKDDNNRTLRILNVIN